MTPHWLDNSLVHALGWTLVHTLWQAALLALITRLLWTLITPHRARLRYGWALSAMGAMLAAAIVTFAFYFEKDGPAVMDQQEWFFTYAPLAAEGALLEEEPVFDDHLAPAPQEPALARLQAAIERSFPWLVLAWLLGTIVMGLRLIGGWRRLQRLSRSGLVSLPPEWTERFARLVEKMDIRRPVQFYLSERVEEPITLKHFKPLILFPVGLLNQLTVEEAEVILLHELAHIRRWDYLVNWLQSILELLFFYHPAVWWLSGEVRKAREHCCDDLVLQRGGARRMLYAQTLTRLTAISFTQQTKLAMSVKGINGTFTQRVKRLFGHSEPSQDWRKPVLSIFICVAILLGFGLSSRAGEDPAPSRDSALDLLEESSSTMVENDSFELKAFVRVDGLEISFSKTSAPFNLVHFYEKQEPSAAEKRAMFFTADDANYNPELKKITASASSMVLKLKEPAPELWMNGRSWGTELEKLEEIDAETLETILWNQKENQLHIYSLGHTPDDFQQLPYSFRFTDIQGRDTVPQTKNSIRIDQDRLEIFKAGGQIDWYRFPKNISLSGEKEEATLMPVSKFSIDLSKQPKFIWMDASYREIKNYQELEQLDAGRIVMIKSYPASERAGGQDRGRIFLYTQKHLERYPESIPSLRFSPEDREQNTVLSAPLAARPLIVLNNEVMGRDTGLINSIAPEKIERVNVSWSVPAMEKYGPEAEDGAIELFTFSIAPETIEKLNFSESLPAMEQYGPEAEDGAIEIFTKKNLARDSDTTKIVIRQGKKEASSEEPLFVIDGKMVAPPNDRNLQELDPDDIDRINVLKGEKALEKYGAEGKDGVVEIFTKKAAKKSTTERMPIEKSPRQADLIKPAPNPLIVIDGEAVGRKDQSFLDQINPETIERINVIKDQPALKKYGPEAENGVIEIFLKPGAKKENLQKPVGKIVDYRSSTEPLYIVNGQVIPADAPYRDVANIKPGQFKVQHLTPAQAVEKYGQAARFGAVFVETDASWPGGKPYYELQYGWGGDLNRMDFLIAHDQLLPRGETRQSNLYQLHSIQGVGAIGLYDAKGRLIMGETTPAGLQDHIYVMPIGQNYSAVVSIYPCENKINGMVYSLLSEEATYSEMLQVRLKASQRVDAKAIKRRCGRKAADQFQAEQDIRTEQLEQRAIVAPDARSKLKEQIEASVFTYPTPFSNEVNIAFTLPERAKTKVSIFTMDGRLVTTLLDEMLEPAEYQLPWAAGSRDPGNYIVRIEAGDAVISRKLIKQ